MRPLKFILVLFSVAAFYYSCGESSTQPAMRLTRDALLGKFLTMVDTMPYYDTTNLNFKILKAFEENDTTEIEEITSYINRTSTTPWMHSYLKSCAINKEFDTLTADEAYKFSYESSFCSFYTIANIIRRENMIIANVTVYENASKMDSLPCSIVQQYETEVDSLFWIKFQEAIFAADFWGLKERNDSRGVDGSSLDVQGYQKDFKGMPFIQPKRVYVSRWSNSMDNLLNPFMMILRLCKTTKGCIRPV